jgi:ribonuclease HI
MIVTINTDASFSFTHKRGGYAFWIVSNQGRFSHSGVLRKTVDNPTVGEFMCIINAMDALGKLRFTHITKIIINTDSLNCKHLICNNTKAIKKYRLNSYGQSLKDKFKNILHKYNFQCIPIEVRHVTSHVGTDTKRQWTNQWCDTHAKEALYKYLNENNLSKIIPAKC